MDYLLLPKALVRGELFLHSLISAAVPVPQSFLTYLCYIIKHKVMKVKCCAYYQFVSRTIGGRVHSAHFLAPPLGYDYPY